MKDLVLWGQHPAHDHVQLKITSGTAQECRAEEERRRKEGWRELTILPRGEAPRFTR